MKKILSQLLDKLPHEIMKGLSSTIRQGSHGNNERSNFNY